MKLLLGTLLLAAGICQAGDIALTIKAHDAPALVLTVPAKAKVTTSATKTEIHTDDMILCVWSIDQAKTVDEGLARIPQVIEHEVLEFAAASTNAITVAGAPAKHLTGRGIEADDHDPATADIVVFTTGKTVFAACVHGEDNAASRERGPMLKVLATARAP